MNVPIYYVNSVFIVHLARWLQFPLQPKTAKKKLLLAIKPPLGHFVRKAVTQFYCLYILAVARKFANLLVKVDKNI